MKVCMCISWVSRYMCICWRQNVSSKSFSEIRSTHITTIHFFRNTYCFPQTSELQFPAQQPSADHSLITLLPITVVMPVEIDGGSQILEPLSIYMGAVIHSGWPTAVSKQPCVLLDNKQQTHTCHNHVFFWATSNQHAQWLPKSITTTCPSGQQKETTRVTVTCTSGQQTPSIQSYYPQRHKYVSFKQAPGKNVTDNFSVTNTRPLWTIKDRRACITVINSSTIFPRYTCRNEVMLFHCPKLHFPWTQPSKCRIKVMQKLTWRNL